MYTDAEFAVALQQVKAEFAAMVAGKPLLTVQETFEIRQYAKSRTDLRSGDLTAEQAAWKAMYVSLTDQLRETAPEMMADVEPLERKADDLRSLAEAIQAKLKAHPHDFGFRVPLAFSIIGGLIGWFRVPTPWSIVVCGLISWVAGFLFSVFVADSAKVQGSVAIWLDRIGFKRTARWLYGRAITTR